MGGRFIFAILEDYLMGSSVVDEFTKSLIGNVGSEVVKEVVRIGYAVASFVIYGMASLMREGKGLGFPLLFHYRGSSMQTSLRTFLRFFLLLRVMVMMSLMLRV